MKEHERNFNLLGCVSCAKFLTRNYAKNHKGRNKLEKECIKKGYIIKKYREIFPDCVESEKEKTGIFALTFNTFHRKGGFVAIR